MPLSLAFAQTTLMLRDVLLDGLRRDAGWTMTGVTPRITTLPHGKPDKGNGDRLNLALISALPGTSVPDALLPAGAAVFQLRYLVTAHVFATLHVELLLGMVLQIVTEHATLGGEVPTSLDPIEAALLGGSGRADVASHLSMGSIAGLRLEPVRLPALIIDVAPVVATASVAQRLIADR